MDAQEVTRLMYMSVPRMQGSAVDQLQGVRHKAVRANRAAGVFSAMYVGAGRLLQWLEGPRSSVMAALARTCRDARHTAHRLIHESHGPRTLVQDWTLRANNVALPGPAWAERFGGHPDFRVAPLHLWECITAPWKGFQPVAAARPKPGTVRRVLLLAADGEGNFDAVRRIARAHGVQLQYERYGIGVPHSADTGGCFVDVGDSSGPQPCLRLHALARNSLNQSLLAALPWDLVVLVQKTGDESRCRQLEACATRFALPGHTARLRLSGPGEPDPALDWLTPFDLYASQESCAGVHPAAKFDVKQAVAEMLRQA